MLTQSIVSIVGNRFYPVFKLRGRDKALPARLVIKSLNQIINRTTICSRPGRILLYHQPHNRRTVGTGKFILVLRMLNLLKFTAAFLIINFLYEFSSLPVSLTYPRDDRIKVIQIIRKIRKFIPGLPSFCISADDLLYILIYHMTSLRSPQRHLGSGELAYQRTTNSTSKHRIT